MKISPLISPSAGILPNRARLAALLLPCLVVSLTGCGAGTVISGNAPGTVVPGMHGVVHGGQNPVGGAAVSLMAAGTSGYGSAPSLLSATTTALGTGTFTLPSHVCPTPDSLVYVQAVGGDSGTGLNTAVHLVTVLGKCSTVTSDTEVEVNEVTTVVAAYALAPFANLSLGGLGIGTSSTNITGLNNVAGPANNLVDTTTGVARATADVSGMVLPTALLNTLGNILAACVNTASAASTTCANLDTYTTVNGVAPVDTFEAAISIAQHPGANVASLYGLATASAPFAPAMTSIVAPPDFTVAIGYNGSGIATYGAIDVAIDATGNAWITTFNTTATLTGLIEITPAGTYPGGAAGYGTTLLAPSVGLGIDQQGVIWVANTDDAAVTAFNSNGSEYTSLPNAVSPNGLAIDGSGDIWTSAGGNGNDTFTEIANLGGAYANPAKIVTADTHFGTGVCISQTYVWEVAAGATDEAASVTLYNPSTNATSSFQPDGGDAGLSGCALDHAGNLWLPDNGQYNGVEVFDTTGALLHSYAVPSPTPAGLYFNPQDLAIDGLGNAFVSQYVYNTRDTSSLTQATVVEFASDGTLISPTGATATQPQVGYAPTTGDTDANGFVGLTSVQISDPGGVAVDGSGDVWMAGRNDGSTVGNFVTEIIGLGAPLVTPKSVGITNNTIATRP